MIKIDESNIKEDGLPFLISRMILKCPGHRRHVKNEGSSFSDFRFVQSRPRRRCLNVELQTAGRSCAYQEFRSFRWNEISLKIRDEQEPGFQLRGKCEIAVTVLPSPGH